jgi:hypothetical protein
MCGRRAEAGTICTCIFARLPPRRQLSILPEPVERSIHLDEHFLRDVLGVVMVPGKLIRDPIHHRPVPLNERLERGGVPPGRAGDQVRVGRHHA